MRSFKVQDMGFSGGTNMDKDEDHNGRYPVDVVCELNTNQTLVEQHQKQDNSR